MQKMTGKHLCGVKILLEMAAKRQDGASVSQTEYFEWKEMWDSNLKNKAEKNCTVMPG